MRKRTKYTSEFKEEAVKIGLSSDEPYSVTADNLGIGRKTFYNWINKSMSEKTHLPPSTKQNGLKYQELERECNKLKKTDVGVRPYSLDPLALTCQPQITRFFNIKKMLVFEPT